MKDTRKTARFMWTQAYSKHFLLRQRRRMSFRIRVHGAGDDPARLKKPRRAAHKSYHHNTHYKEGGGYAFTWRAYRYDRQGSGHMD